MEPVTSRLRLCETRKRGDKVMRRLHKVRTGSGSDRVVFEMLDYAGHYKSLALLKKTKRFGMRFDPVATAPGTGMIGHAFRPGRYRSRDGNDWACVSTRSLPLPGRE